MSDKVREEEPLLKSRSRRLCTQYHAPEEDSQKKAPLWLISFTDIMALMLTFFVLLYSMSVPKVDQWSLMVSVLNQGLSQSKTMDRFSGNMRAISIDKISRNKALDLDYLTLLLQNNMKNHAEFDDVYLFRGRRQLIISLPLNLLFDSGSASINVQGQRSIYKLSAILSRIGNRVEVVGHADPGQCAGAA